MEYAPCVKHAQYAPKRATARLCCLGKPMVPSVLQDQLLVKSGGLGPIIANRINDWYYQLLQKCNVYLALDRYAEHCYIISRFQETPTVRVNAFAGYRHQPAGVLSDWRLHGGNWLNLNEGCSKPCLMTEGLKGSCGKDTESNMCFLLVKSQFWPLWVI